MAGMKRMDELRIIPLSFIDRFGELTWPEVHLGIKENWLSLQSAIDIAVRRIQAGSNDASEIELAGLTTSEFADASDIVSRLANDEIRLESERPKTTWFRLIMAWLYENRSRTEDPFLIIEVLYADFGYPAEIRHLVRYNPTTRALDDKSAAQKQMETDWAEYVRSISLPGRV